MANNSIPRPVQRHSRRRNILGDLYHLFLVCKWRYLVLTVALGLVLVNCLFAELHLFSPGSIRNATPGSFVDAFLFSAQTLSTVGYGDLSPNGVYAGVVAAVESFLGLFAFALSSALFFAKFSRPCARVLFSRNAVITQRDGGPCLVFRLANERTSSVLEAQLNVIFVRTERTVEGEQVRKLYDLELTRKQTPVFALTWTVVHRITPSSPLYGQTRESLKACDGEIFLTFMGLEDSFVQTVHSRHRYALDDLLWNRRFVDILSQDADGTRHVDYGRSHDTVEA